eukprot:TRINITY_DN8439_c1_g1_i2.p2 TRINITY_DN8439_c1_g1~~TRINITY_DN8439_c1_g1_i2.p2  ORF type:complete len:283 (+),score=6.22 TRINITY_DN8439_c1_g1_i2:264-1112(+)
MPVSCILLGFNRVWRCERELLHMLFFFFLFSRGRNNKKASNVIKLFIIRQLSSLSCLLVQITVLSRIGKHPALINLYASQVSIFNNLCQKQHLLPTCFANKTSIQREKFVGLVQSIFSLFLNIYIFFQGLQYILVHDFLTIPFSVIKIPKNSALSSPKKKNKSNVEFLRFDVVVMTIRRILNKKRKQFKNSSNFGGYFFSIPILSFFMTSTFVAKKLLVFSHKEKSVYSCILVRALSLGSPPFVLFNRLLIVVEIVIMQRYILQMVVRKVIAPFLRLPSDIQ